MKTLKLKRKIKQSLLAVIYSTRFLGRNVRIDSSSLVSPNCVVSVCGGGSVLIGKNCEIHRFSMIMTYGGNIIIGNNCSINPFTILYGHGGLRIGSGVRIAAHTVIIPANHVKGNEEAPLYLQEVSAEGIEIDDYVWIGAGVRILDGVRIGRHAVIGAGAVVTSSVPDYSTAVGVPARVVSCRSEN